MAPAAQVGRHHDLDERLDWEAEPLLRTDAATRPTVHLYPGLDGRFLLNACNSRGHQLHQGWLQTRLKRRPLGFPPTSPSMGYR